MPDASIVITTRNRGQELARAVASALRQRGDIETLVIDDGSSDGSPEMIRRDFPAVKLHRFETSAGYIVRRNQAASLASAPFIISIDDDAEFSSDLVVQQALAGFQHPRVGAVAIPFINVNQSPKVFQTAPDGATPYACENFIGTAHALRRDLFLALGGYREPLVHQGEESDYCLRMLDRGHVVALAGSDPILHHESPRRDFSRMDYYGARNLILFAWQNVPMPRLVPHLLATTANSINWTRKHGRYRHALTGIAAGYAGIFSSVHPRQPVRSATYQLSRRLRRDRAVPLDELERTLPAARRQD